MTDRMPCRISDGPQEPGDVPYTSREVSDYYTDGELQDELDERHADELPALLRRQAD